MMVSVETQKRTRKSVAPSSGSVAPQRPVRFVTNNDEPLSKRRRISAACRTCQRRKTKCSGERPDCSTCLESDTVCLGYAQHNHGANKGSKAARLPQIRDDHQQSESLLQSIKISPENHGRPRSHEGKALRNSPTSCTLQPANSEDSISSKDGNFKVFEPPAVPSSNDHPEYPLHYRARVPYFRFFGTTAMVPGFKQMVVDLNHHPELEPIKDAFKTQDEPEKIGDGSKSSQRQTSSPPTPTMPFYTRNDRTPVHPLIRELCDDFFIHLGGNYPFLTRNNFMRDLGRKQIDTILVDAICAIAARFSKNSILVRAGQAVKCDDRCADRTHKSKFGSVFASRAMSAVIDFFACPTLAAVQACLLLAYEQFGADHDSGLWMYLGLSIRMAQDLGIQKLEGLEYEGYLGPTPKTAKSGAAGQAEENRRAEKYRVLQAQHPIDDERAKEQRMIELERINTFWAIFFLDRVVSSGTGRPVTLRDKDIEISFPPRDETNDTNKWPAPFPALIRIVHSYGRVANLLNNIGEANQLTPEIMKQLVAAEDDLIGIYQRLSPKLHFSAANFQHYLKQSQATNFILLHFWFHTLIVLLHQPTLLHSFEGRIQQLFPNSQELSLSSAKTIADILSFAELLDSKSFIGNPFTSQPMYFAACAFLLESVSHSISRPQSRVGTPPATPLWSASATTLAPKNQIPRQSFDRPAPIQRPENRQAHAKRGLLAAAASQNYQRCYKALKALETYWAGTRYIVTVLDQKAKGSLDPLLYTAEYLGTSEIHPDEKFQSSKGNRPDAIQDDHIGPFNPADHYAHLVKLKSAVGPRLESLGNGKSTEASQAIGWSLTGSSDSAGSNLSVFYQTARDEGADPHPKALHASNKVSEYESLGLPRGMMTSNGTVNSHNPSEANLEQPMSLFGGDSAATTRVPNTSQISHLTNAQTLDSTLSDYLSENQPYFSPSNDQIMSMRPPGSKTSHFQPSQPTISDHSSFSAANSILINASPGSAPSTSIGVDSQAYRFDNKADEAFNDMIIESQDIDTSALGLDPLLWLDFMPQTGLESFDIQNNELANIQNLEQ